MSLDLSPSSAPLQPQVSGFFFKEPLSSSVYNSPKYKAWTCLTRGVREQGTTPPNSLVPPWLHLSTAWKLLSTYWPPTPITTATLRFSIFPLDIVSFFHSDILLNLEKTSNNSARNSLCLDPKSPIIYILPQLLYHSLPPSLSAQLFLKLSHFAYGKTEAQGVFSGPFPLPHTRGPILEVQNLKPANMSKAYEVFENWTRKQMELTTADSKWIKCLSKCLQHLSESAAIQWHSCL